MAIIRWNPWRLSQSLEEDWDFPTLPFVSKLGQGLNLYETNEEIVAELALPGIKEDDIDITLEEGVVRVSASTKQSTEQSEERKYFMSSMSSNYNYSFRLPETLIQDQEPQCELENGVLKMVFKKAEKVAPKKIAVTKKSA